MNPATDSIDVPARRASGFAIPPLVVLALTFAMPTLRACGNVESPLSMIGKNPGMAAWIVPPYLGAVLLALTTLAPIVMRRVVARGEFATAHVALALNVLGTVFGLMGFLFDRDLAWPVVAWEVTCISLALFVFVRATRLAGWSRWVRYLGVYAAFVCGNTVTVLIATGLSESPADIFVGGKLYLSALALLVVLVTYGMDPRGGATGARPG